MVVYVGTLALLVSVFVATLVPLVRSYGNLAASRDVNASAFAALDRFVREAREADSVVLGSSVLGAHPGRIVFLKTDGNNVVSSVEFSLVSGALHVFTDGVDMGPLTRSSVAIDSLVFRAPVSGDGSMATVEVTLRGTSGRAARTASFSGSAVLRGSYSASL